MALADGLVGSLLLLLVAEAPALVRVLLHLLILALAVSIGLQYLLTAGNHDGIDVVCVVIKAQFLVVIIKRLLHRGWLSLASSIRAVFRVESRVPFLGKSRGICHILLLWGCAFVFPDRQRGRLAHRILPAHRVGVDSKSGQGFV
jgi:hypothetical protein